MSDYIEDRREQGFTLIELLVAIVVVGILAAVAIVGIAGLTNTGGQSACKASEDAARASAAAYAANNNNVWPTSFNDMTEDPPPSGLVNHPPVLELANNVKAQGSQLVGNHWTLTGQFDANGGKAPTYLDNACSST